MNASPPPFFVVGPVRSGTTVLRLMLGRHAQIGCCQEFEMVLPLLADDQPPPSMDEVLPLLSRRFDVWHYRLKLPQHVSSVKELAENLLAQLSKCQPGQLRGGATHNHYAHLPDLWPDVRVIYLRRDPRDILRSCVALGMAGNVLGAMPIWMRAFQQWQRLKEKLPESQRLEIEFGELLKNPALELQKICQFLGIAYDPGMLRVDQSSSYQPPDPMRADSWQKSASQREIQLMEACLGNWLSEAGYAPSGLPIKRLGAIRQAGLWIDHRLRRWRRNVRKFGWVWFGVLFTRMYPQSRLHQEFLARHRRIHESKLR